MNPIGSTQRISLEAVVGGPLVHVSTFSRRGDPVRLMVISSIKSIMQESISLPIQVMIGSSMSPPCSSELLSRLIEWRILAGRDKSFLILRRLPLYDITCKSRTSLEVVSPSTLMEYLMNALPLSPSVLYVDVKRYNPWEQPSLNRSSGLPIKLDACDVAITLLLLLHIRCGIWASLT